LLTAVEAVVLADLLQVRLVLAVAVVVAVLMPQAVVAVFLLKVIEVEMVGEILNTQQQVAVEQVATE
jgi:hypothetical protein